jgi:DNA-binding response OmpR family regulator
MRILLVDDEKELVSTLAERLDLRGIEADWVSSGEEALQKAETGSYDLAVLDVKMPKIGGFKLKKILHEKYPEMKFIFLTGHGSEDDFKAGTMEEAVAYYLVKPVKIEALVDKINSALKNQPS